MCTKKNRVQCARLSVSQLHTHTYDDFNSIWEFELRTTSKHFVGNILTCYRMKSWLSNDIIFIDVRAFPIVCPHELSSVSKKFFVPQKLMLKIGSFAKQIWRLYGSKWKCFNCEKSNMSISSFLYLSNVKDTRVPLQQIECLTNFQLTYGYEIFTVGREHMVAHC